MTHDEALIKFYPLIGQSSKDLKKNLNGIWLDYKMAKELIIESNETFSLSVFYLKNKHSLFLPATLAEKDEIFIVLNGSCVIQTGNDISIKKKGDFIHIKRNLTNSLKPNCKEVTVGHVFFTHKPSLKMEDLKYSKSRRASIAKTNSHQNRDLMNSTVMKNKENNQVTPVSRSRKKSIYENRNILSPQNTGRGVLG